MIKECDIRYSNDNNLKPQNIIHNSDVYKRIPYGCEKFKLKLPTCSDCGCKIDSLHHLGCDIERCPRCGGQLMTCNCKFIVFKGDQNL